jgi:2-phosphoglycerate kinase
MKKVKVIKFNGEEEPFSKEKVYRSARRVGAPDQLAREISRVIEKEVYPGMKTSQIFSQVKRRLKQKTPRAALRFNLKKAIRRLGPTGFPFEKYIGEVFSNQGFKVWRSFFQSRI